MIALSIRCGDPEMAGARTDLVKGVAAAANSMPVEWRRSQGLIAYEEAVAVMEARAAAVADAGARELVWLLEHPPLYTAGTSAKAPDLIEARFPVHVSGRGGQFTYHGPGQRVVYVVLDLRRRGQDLRRFVATLEEWIIRTLAVFGVTGERREHMVGVWVRRTEPNPEREDKIAAIGLRLKRWITLHGIALNVSCELSHYGGIVPCGVSGPGYGITSLADLGVPVTMAQVDAALRSQFEVLFGSADSPYVATTQVGADPAVTHTV
jgi:lipoyl(octanoyl) transferase